MFEALQLEAAKEAFKIVISANPRNMEAIDHYTDVLEQLAETDEMEKLLG
jgi:hypothetical protein